jgi:hypothetical protein
MLGACELRASSSAKYLKNFGESDAARDGRKEV